MKILVSGDWHLDLVIDGYDMHGDIVRAAQQVKAACEDDVDLFVHLGDLFHTWHPSPRAYATVIRLFRDWPCPAVVILGNHDVEGGIGGRHAFEPLIELWKCWSDSVRFMCEPTVVVGDSVLNGMAFVPWPIHRSSFEEKLVRVSGDSSYRAVFSHCDVDGVVKMPNDGVMVLGKNFLPQSILRSGKPIFNGHIHMAQKRGNIDMPGSIVTTAMGQSGENGYILAEV